MIGRVRREAIDPCTTFRLCSCRWALTALSSNRMTPNFFRACRACDPSMCCPRFSSNRGVGSERMRFEDSCVRTTDGRTAFQYINAGRRSRAFASSLSNFGHLIFPRPNSICTLQPPVSLDRSFFALAWVGFSSRLVSEGPSTGVAAKQRVSRES